jgi:hypothetical protein
MKYGKAFLLALLLCLLPLTAVAGVKFRCTRFSRAAIAIRTATASAICAHSSKLDYIQALGADSIWLTPVSPSPSYHKYDVTAYCVIDRVSAPLPITTRGG